MPKYYFVRTFNPLVWSSILPRPTNKSKGYVYTTYPLFLHCYHIATLRVNKALDPSWIRIVICKIFGARVATPVLHISVLRRQKREKPIFIDLKLETGGDATSIGRLPLPMLEVLCKPTLTLFVKKSFLFWRENFSWYR